MKIKPLYLYGTLVLLALIFLVIFATGGPHETTSPHPDMSKQMPDDELHRGLSPHSSMGMVNEEIKRKMELYNQAIQDNPDDTLSMREYADLLNAAHKPDEALTLYNNILNKDSKRTDIRFTTAIIYYLKQDYDTAEKLMREILDYDKDNERALYNIGAVELARGNNEKAANIWHDVIKKAPNSDAADAARTSLKDLQ